MLTLGEQRRIVDENRVGNLRRGISSRRSRSGGRYRV